MTTDADKVTIEFRPCVPASASMHNAALPCAQGEVIAHRFHTPNELGQVTREGCFKLAPSEDLL